MTFLTSKFSFFKAGQGAFYGGRISTLGNHENYTIVYDCGTSPFIYGHSKSFNNEINLFKRTGSSKNIDLLFISHLDYDHVSGLQRLLTEFNVKRIILPYIEKDSRSFSIFSAPYPDSPDNSDLSTPDYLTFLENPIEFINENSIDKDIQLFLVDSTQGSPEYLNYINDINTPDGIYPRGTLADKNSVKELSEIQGNIYLYKNNLQFFIRNIWEFTTHVKEVNHSAIRKLNSCLKKIVKSDNATLNLKDLEDLIKNHRPEAHKCYTKHLGKINSHGLVLLHSPINFKFCRGKVTGNGETTISNYLCKSFTGKKREMIATLLFGDASINSNNNSVNFSSTFKGKLKDVHIVQVPHHGSLKNWDFNKFKNLKIGESISEKTRIIKTFNFGHGNNYGHPAREVLADLSPIIYLNSQFSRLNIYYWIE